MFIFSDFFYGSHFRSTQDPISSSQQAQLEGLHELQASGSGPIRMSELNQRLGSVNGPKIIVDGMAEFHGYIQGIPTSFFGYQRKSPNLKHIIRRWLFTGTSEIRPDLITPEEDEAKKYGFTYQKVTIGSKFIMDDKDVNEIVKIFETLPQNAWLHFHCAQGKGLTSMLLVMFDITKNAPKVSLEDIAKRHFLLGSEDLLSSDVWRKGTYSEHQLKDRIQFLKNFYSFICQKKDGGLTSWSAWIQQQTKENLKNNVD